MPARLAPDVHAAPLADLRAAALPAPRLRSLSGGRAGKPPHRLSRSAAWFAEALEPERPAPVLLRLAR